MTRQLTYSIPADDLPCSLRSWLKKRGFSRRVLSSLKQDPSSVTVDGVPIRLVTYLTAPCTVVLLLRDDDGRRLSPSSPGDLPPVSVVYEDEDVIVFDKPPFMPTHPVHGHQGDTLADFSARHAASRGEGYTFRPIGRLDRNTSGLCLAAKTAYAARVGSTANKVYLAVAQGVIDAPGVVDAPIRRKEGSRILREVSDGGDPAVTAYEPVKVCGDTTLLRLRLQTGRTHQIRVHLSSLGHPLVGDDLYGGPADRISRHALHCGELSFAHPVTGEQMTFSSPLPADMAALLTEQEETP